MIRKAEPMLRKVQRLSRDVQAARKVLRKLQHCDGGSCPECSASQPYHEDWCVIWKELRKSRERPSQETPTR